MSFSPLPLVTPDEGPSLKTSKFSLYIFRKLSPYQQKLVDKNISGFMPFFCYWSLLDANNSVTGTFHNHRFRASTTPVWKVCITQPRYRPHNFDAFYIFTIKFSKSWLCNFQTFQLGATTLEQSMTSNKMTIC